LEIEYIPLAPLSQLIKPGTILINDIPEEYLPFMYQDRPHFQ